MLRRVIAAVVVAAAVSATAAAQDVKLPEIEFGRYHALVIGNNDYQHLRNLTTAVGDAEAVAKLLEEKYGFKVTKLINATRRNIAGALNRLRQTLTQRDNLLIYYAGHGVLDEEAGAGYWQPVDARPDDDTDWFSNTRLTSYLKAMSARHVMVVADSCYSGNLTRAATSTVRSGAERTTWMQRMNDKRSRTALTSGGLEPVLDQGGGGHSVFAGAFLTALEENPDVLFGEELFDRLKGVVVANAEQTPEYSDIRYTGHEKGDFLFVPLDINVSVTVRTPPTGQADREAIFWQSIQDSDDPAMFEAYLRRYPTGEFADIAKLKIKAIPKAKEQQTALVVPPKPEIEVDPVEAEYVAVKNANVRAEPTVRSGKVTTLKRGTTVQVAGKVKGGNWYLVERDDKPLGYVFGELLMEPEAARLALAVPPKPPGAARPAVDTFPPRPGEAFRDCAECPEMMVIPAGSFTMGSPASEEGRDDDEGPRHRVTIPRAFALGKHEVTRAEFAAFVRDTTGHDPRGCRVYTGEKWEDQSSRSWRDPNFSQSDRDPVVCVNWDDAKKYVRWLSRKTGKEYRLPSESEWEYAARAGTTAARYWGEDADRACDYGNVHDRTSKSENGFTWTHHDCRDGYGKTAPVGSFRANDFGLHDVLGNVWEWVEDCYEKTYDLAPRDGSAWTTGECPRRVLRGGSWFGNPGFLRAAFRGRIASGYRSYIIGFRFARTLP